MNIPASKARIQFWEVFFWQENTSAILYAHRPPWTNLYWPMCICIMLMLGCKGRSEFLDHFFLSVTFPSNSSVYACGSNYVFCSDCTLHRHSFWIQKCHLLLLECVFTNPYSPVLFNDVFHLKYIYILRTSRALRVSNLYSVLDLWKNMYHN